MKGFRNRFTQKPTDMMLGVEHVGDKKFAEHGAEYLQRERAVRRHRTGGRPHGRHRPVKY
jgi:hypothetical protein